MDGLPCWAEKAVRPSNLLASLRSLRHLAKLRRKPIFVADFERNLEEHVRPGYEIKADEEFDFSSLADYRTNADFIEATEAAALVVFVSTGNWTQMPINDRVGMQNFAELRSLRLQSCVASRRGFAACLRGFDDAISVATGVRNLTAG